MTQGVWTMADGVAEGEPAGVAVGAGGEVGGPVVAERATVGALLAVVAAGDRGGGRVVAEAAGVAGEGAVVDTGPGVEVPAGAGRDVGDGA